MGVRAWSKPDRTTLNRDTSPSERVVDDPGPVQVSEAEFDKG